MDEIIEISENDETELAELQDEITVFDLNGDVISRENSRTPIDPEIIKKAVNGDKSAFSELYMQSYRYVFFVVKNYIPDDDIAYDAIQETFIKVYKNIDRLRAPEAFYSWLTAIAKNTARDFLRNERANTAELSEKENYSDFLKDEKDVSLDIEAVLKKLDPEDAHLLSLVYYDGLSITKIARMQEKPFTTVYSRFAKAKRNLKAQLTARGIDKAIYSGNFVSMVTVALRNIIGTALLSVAIAQQILNSIISGKDKKELAIAKVIKSHQKKAILKIASVIVAISVATSAATALSIIGIHQFKNSDTDGILQQNSLASEYYYDTDSTENTSAQNSSPSDEASSADSSNTTDTSSENSSQSSSFGAGISPSSNSSSSKNSSAAQSSPQSSSTVSSETVVTETIPDVLGNNPNNVTLPDKNVSSIAKQGDWLYYVYDNYSIAKVKTDGSGKQIIYQQADYEISYLNIIENKLYFIKNGVCSMSIDGTDFKQLNTNSSASQLLVKGNKGYFTDCGGLSFLSDPLDEKYNLYQINIQTGETQLIVGKATGTGLKTIIGNTLFYADGNTVYARDITSGSTKVLTEISSGNGIDSLLVNGDKLYISEYKVEKVLGIDINSPAVIQNTYPLISAQSYIGSEDLFFVYMNKKTAQLMCFYTSQGKLKYNAYKNWGEVPYNEIMFIPTVFDDGYVYCKFFDENILFRCKTDGTDYTEY